MHLKGTERNMGFFWNEGEQEVRVSAPADRWEIDFVGKLLENRLILRIWSGL